MNKVVLSIGGMSCSACSNGLEKFLRKQKGIVEVTVNLILATASVVYDDTISIKEIENYILDAGFESLGPADLTKDNKGSKMPLIIYGVISVLLMYISMAHMFNGYLPKFLDMAKNPVNYGLCLFILTIPFLYYGFDIIKNGFKNLIHKMPNMDTLVSIGIISSFCYSTYSVIRVILGDYSFVHNLYFESTVFVIYFIKLGRYIDNISKNKTRNAIKNLVVITPRSAKIKKDNEVIEVTIDEIKKGDILVCLPGDKIAVDGKIIKGSSHFDESFLTGESKPVSKKKDDLVMAGAINYEGYIEYEALKVGKDTIISEMVNLVVNALNTKAPIALLADKISGYFVPFIIALAILTFGIYLILGFDFNSSLNYFVTVLVVACPCALGFATPLAIVVSEGVCAKKGILVKSNEVWEIGSKVTDVIFDKTGTLTDGKLSIYKFNNYSKESDQEILKIIGCIEKKSNHPIAKALLKYIEKRKIELEDAKVEVQDGLGLVGIINRKKYYVGNSKLLKKYKIKNNYEKDEELLSKKGCSIIYLAESKNVLALIGVKDNVKKDAKIVIEKLNALNISTIMLTGDNEVTAHEVAKELNVKKVIANVTPKEKMAVIKKLKEEGKIVMMVGDGINDVPSLALADIGISVFGGLDIASDSSDIVFMNDKLSNIIDVINISKKALKNIKQNLTWAFLYNIIMIPIAMGLFKSFGLEINPMIACVSMILSSFTVTLNALRLKI